MVLRGLVNHLAKGLRFGLDELLHILNPCELGVYPIAQFLSRFRDFSPKFRDNYCERIRGRKEKDRECGKLDSSHFVASPMRLKRKSPRLGLET
jgi:hypothetical protein